MVTGLVCSVSALSTKETGNSQSTIAAITSPQPLGEMTAVKLTPGQADQHGAKCLDGTPPAFRYRRGTGANASRFIVFLEGGGWCFGAAECAGRAKSSIGTSDNFENCTDMGGVMSINATENPDFHTWTMVFVHYCDGASFTSGRPAALPFASAPHGQLWFRGRANLNAVFDVLLNSYGMAKADALVLSGGSAGGLAVYLNIDHVAQLMRKAAPQARVVGFPDAGYFADLATAQNTSDYWYREQFQYADATAWNSTASGGTNEACLTAMASAAASAGVKNDQAWRCLMAEYVTDFIETPLYVMNGAFDVYQVQNILRVGCVPQACTAAQLDAISGYRKAFISQSLKHLTARAGKVGHGAYIPSCLIHEGKFIAAAVGIHCKLHYPTRMHPLEVLTHALNPCRSPPRLYLHTIPTLLTLLSSLLYLPPSPLTSFPLSPVIESTYYCPSSIICG